MYLSAVKIRVIGAEPPRLDMRAARREMRQRDNDRHPIRQDSQWL